jgi:importin subunit alpha-6/7
LGFCDYTLFRQRICLKILPFFVPRRNPLPGGHNLHEFQAKRRTEIDEFTASNRDRLLASKRFKKSTDQLILVDEATVLAAVEQIKNSTDQTHLATPSHIQALKDLRSLLSSPILSMDTDLEATIIDTIINAEVVPLLIIALQPPPTAPVEDNQACSRQSIYEAAWCLTNLAAGSSKKAVDVILPAAPLLISLIKCEESSSGGTWGREVAEQCAWAIGNLAGDVHEAYDYDYQSDTEKNAVRVLISYGAVNALSQMIVSSAQALKETQQQQHQEQDTATYNDTTIITCGVTAAWALSNVIKQSGPLEVSQFMSCPGAAEAAIYILSSVQAASAAGAAIADLVAEVCWVLSMVTACKEVHHLNRIIQLGVLPELMTVLVAFTQAYVKSIAATTSEGGDLEEEANRARALLTPVLRCFGNIVAGGGTDMMNQLFICLSDPLNVPIELRTGGGSEKEGEEEKTANQSPLSKEHVITTLQAVVDCAQSHHIGLKKEAVLVLTNIAGCPGNSGVKALMLKEVGAVPVLIQNLKHGPFHIKKGAALALANIAAAGGGGTGDSELLVYLFQGDREVLHEMTAGMMKAADLDAAALGLQFTAMYLRGCPNTKEAAGALEACGALDGLDRLQYGADVPEKMRVAAAAIIDGYFGDDGNGNEEEIVTVEGEEE